MGMRMKPKRRSRLIDVQDRAPTIAGMNQLLRPPITITGPEAPTQSSLRTRVSVFSHPDLVFAAAAHATAGAEERREVAVGRFRFSLKKCFSTRRNLERNCVPLVCRV